MQYTEFARRFRDHQEIGRDVTDTHLLVFFDNGTDVGLWRENRRTTEGAGEVLGPDEAGKARYWYRNGARKWVEAERHRQAAAAQTPACSSEARR